VVTMLPVVMAAVAVESCAVATIDVLALLDEP
jgi:hypothetical protein